MDELILVRPRAEHAEQVMAYKEEMAKNGDSFDGCAGLEETETYEEWLDFDTRLKKKGYVPSEVFLAVRKEDNKVVGIIDYRRPLTPFLLKYGGNIGYSILPSERRKGYATKMLKILLPVAKSTGKKRCLSPAIKPITRPNAPLSKTAAFWKTKLRMMQVSANAVLFSGIG